MIQREIHRLGVQHLAAMAVIRHVAGRQHAATSCSSTVWSLPARPCRPDRNCAGLPRQSRRSRDPPEAAPFSAPPAPPCEWRARFRPSTRSRRTARRATASWPPRSPESRTARPVTRYCRSQAPGRFRRTAARDRRSWNCQCREWQSPRAALPRAHVAHCTLRLVKLDHSTGSPASIFVMRTNSRIAPSVILIVGLRGSRKSTATISRARTSTAWSIAMTRSNACIARSRAA